MMKVPEWGPFLLNNINLERTRIYMRRYSYTIKSQTSLLCSSPISHRFRRLPRLELFWHDYIILFFLFFMVFNPVMASVRIDLKDRTPEEVIQKSCYLAQCTGPAEVVVSIICASELSTGILLDPETILTCAHSQYSQEAPPLRFILGTNTLVLGAVPLQIREKISHPKFKIHEVSGTEFLRIHSYCFMNGIPSDRFDKIGFDEFFTLKKTVSSFSGVDLAILKLAVPVSEALPFPTFLDPEYDVVDTYGISYGYGPMKFNTQNKGPQPATLDSSKMLQRHLMSHKVTAYDTGFSKVLYGSYKGVTVHGNESFMPSSDMRKTEGLPVGGDSGGPLCIQTEATAYQLAGICSATYAMNSLPIDATETKRALGKTIQNIYPVWTDIRPYIPWIKENMRG